MNGTARLSLPFLSPGQAQKEFTHNEALQALDIAVAAAIEEAPRSDPPTAPALGACYIVGSSPTGEWAGKAQSLAAFTTGGWRFLAPIEGLSVYVKDSGVCATYRIGDWEVGSVRGSSVIVGGQQVVGGRGAAITLASGGATIDGEARTAIGAILTALRQHGLIES